MSTVYPMPIDRRIRSYLSQTGRVTLTVRQARRVAKKARRQL